MPYPHSLHHNRPYPDKVCRMLRQGRQLIEVIFLKDEILHDIEADTLAVERSRHLEDTPVAIDERRQYEASRYIDHALNDVVRKCSAYLLLPSPYAHRISTNHTKGWEEKSIYLALPHNWPPHLIGSVRDYAHDYIVKYAESSLLAPVLSPQDSYVQYLSLAAQTALDDLNAAINERLGRDIIHPTLFG